MSAPNRDEYLGDGLYASYDGYYIWLKAPRENGWHEVGLEPQVLVEFFRYLKSCKYDLEKLTRLAERQ